MDLFCQVWKDTAASKYLYGLWRLWLVAAARVDTKHSVGHSINNRGNISDL